MNNLQEYQEKINRYFIGLSQYMYQAIHKVVHQVCAIIDCVSSMNIIRRLMEISLVYLKTWLKTPRRRQRRIPSLCLYWWGNLHKYQLKIDRDIISLFQSMHKDLGKEEYQICVNIGRVISMDIDGWLMEISLDYLKTRAKYAGSLLI